MYIIKFQGIVLTMNWLQLSLGQWRQHYSRSTERYRRNIAGSIQNLPISIIIEMLAILAFIALIPSILQLSH